MSFNERVAVILSWKASIEHVQTATPKIPIPNSDLQFKMLLAALADRFVLCPSRNQIAAEDLTPERIDTPFGFLEAWCCDSVEGRAGDYDVVAIKFPGAGGRAERSGPHPFELWEGLNARVWTINHHGYGASSGTASLQKLAQTCDAVWQSVVNRHPSKKIVLIGNSLGCLSALYVAARYPAAGAYLRNPPPIAQLIRDRPRYNWWNFGFAKLIAKQIPAELDAVANAGNSRCPALFVCSEKDSLVPTSFQQLIYEQYAGPHTTFVIEKAEHHDRIPVRQEREFLEAVDWLRARVIENCGTDLRAV